jgi:FKBP-type peptidyl-prolyl cis-trans isomerase FkpA
MKRLIIIAVILLTALPVCAETRAKAEAGKPEAIKPQVDKPRKKISSFAPVKLKTEEQKALYGLGLVIARQMEVFNLSAKELQIVKQGIYDGVKGRKPKVDFAVYSKKSVELGRARRDAHGKLLAAKTPAFMEAAADEDGALKSPSGVIYLSLKEGEGASPVETDKVKFHHRATLIDGREVESSYKSGEPDVGILKESLPCLTEAIKLMKKGGKARVICPPETAFGKEGAGVIPPDAALVFEVELLEISKP